MPSTPANSAFNLKPAGFPINHTHPERKNEENPCIKFKTERQTDSARYSNAQPTKFPRRISTTKVDHIECLCIAAFSTYSTHDCDLAHKRMVLNMEKTKNQYQKLHKVKNSKQLPQKIKKNKHLILEDKFKLHLQETITRSNIFVTVM